MQGGYLLANMMVIALGTWRAMIFQIVGSLITVVALPSNITIPTVTTFVGHRLGAGDRAGARRETLAILLWGLAFSLALGLIVALLGKPLVRM